jgi:hypothetical protein
VFTRYKLLEIERRVFTLGQRLRRFADHVATIAGAANGTRVRRWIRAKKAGWYAVLADPRMPVTSTLLDQAHNAIERKLFMRRGFHHPQGNQQAFLNGLTLLDDLVPYQRRASMPVNVAWKSKEATSLHATGSSTSKSSR